MENPSSLDILNENPPLDIVNENTSSLDIVNENPSSLDILNENPSLDIVNENLSSLDIVNEKSLLPRPLPTPLLTPLIFNDTVDTTNVKNLLLIDYIVSESQLFFDSSNQDTFPIIYSNNSSKDDFIKLLEDKFSNGLERIAFVFHDNIKDGKEFLNQELFFLESDFEVKEISSYSPNTELLITVVKKFGVKNIDFLACNSLNYPNWVNFYDLLAKETGVVVGASNDKTGNLNHGGDWLMENTNENVVTTYFNSNIENYASTLATSVISSSITLTQMLIDIGDYIWPVTVNGGTLASPVVITFGEDITLNSVSEYFIIGSEYITFEGNYKTVTISGVTAYLGLIKNGTNSANGYANIVINNINFAQLSSSIEGNSGWVCQSYFGKGVTYCNVNNCNTDVTCDGNISQYIGLICGASANGVKCNNCSSAGNIASGGIFGSSVRNCEANNCYSTGQIGNNFISVGAGGIYGYDCDNTNKANQCYSTGNIYYSSEIYGSGGICGSGCGVNVTNCYSNGIIGFNTGFLFAPCGGIFGNSSTGSATNCYSSGLKRNGGVDIGGTGTKTNCYSANNNWSDSAAKSALTGFPTDLYSNNPGTTWASIGAITQPNTPYILSSFNSSLYATSTVNNTSSGGYTSSAGLFTPGYNYNLISVNNAITPNNITINNTSGVLTFTNLTSWTYTEEIFCSKGAAPKYYGYNFNTFILNQTIPIPGITITNNGGIIYIWQDGNIIKYFIGGVSVAPIPITNWPVTFINSNPVAGNILTVLINSPITISATTVGTGTNGYFITGSGYITYDGTGKTVTIDSVTDYPGLIQNGSSSVNGYSNVTVKNINSGISGSSTLATSGGWICQGYFGKASSNILIDNCSNSGVVNGLWAGGICGSYAGNNFGTVSVTNCSNTGVISGQSGGGICGLSTGNNNGIVSITNCSNSGAISINYGGGICGGDTGFFNGSVSITKCYNNGAISGQFSGGITSNFFGTNSSYLCSIINCYNTGNITGSNAGGITGSEIGYNNNSAYTPQILIENCYSLGNIATTAGGICGGTEGRTYTNIPTINIKNCYTSYNSIVNSGSEYVSTSLPTVVRNSIISRLSNVYSSLISSWSDTSANSALSGPPRRFFQDSARYIYYTNFGLTWYSKQPNTPFFLISNLDKIPRRKIRQ